MVVRRERSTDIDAIRAVHLAAFPAPEPGHAPVEAALVDALRIDPAAWLPRLSLVAEVDGTVVGHVVCSRGQLDGTIPALGLAPLAVLPAHQRHGIGGALVHAVCAAADALDEAIVVLLGSPAFYGRLGFQPAHALGIAPQIAAWARHFQARPLAAYDPARDRGRFTYAAPFDAF